MFSLSQVSGNDVTHEWLLGDPVSIIYVPGSENLGNITRGNFIDFCATTICIDEEKLYVPYFNVI